MSVVNTPVIGVIDPMVPVREVVHVRLVKVAACGVPVPIGSGDAQVLFSRVVALRPPIIFMVVAVRVVKVPFVKSGDNLQLECLYQLDRG